MDPINIIVVGVIALGVIFGAKKIPEMARSIGRAQGEFKKGLKEGHVEDDEPAAKAEAPKEPEKD
jgi:sec-independent protein translocase protein TatA